MTGDPYDPPDADVLNVIADEWVTQLEETAALGEPQRHPALEVGDTVPPYVNEFDVGYRAVDTWHGGNPGPAIEVVRRALLDAGAVARLRSSAIGALERRGVRWAVHHRTELPMPLSGRRYWEVTDVDRFEATMAGFLRYPHPLPAEVRDRIVSWSARPETDAGAPERDALLDEFIGHHRRHLEPGIVIAETRDHFRRWYIDTYQGTQTDFADRMWRWLRAEGALRSPTSEERAVLGVVPEGTRVWDRDRLAAALPELTRSE